ncbi:MAG: flavin-containing monooxygenase [Acidimicrobiales bacterium]
MGGDAAAGQVDVDVVVVGAGFAGLYQLHRLRGLGLSTIVLEAGDGLGGIWYWNCYPGARVDSHVPLYEYSDENVWRGWSWEERFPGWQSLRRYFGHVDSQWNLRHDVRFGARLDRATWDEAGRRWQVDCGGDRLRRRFLVLCAGFAANAFVPALPGLGEFGGEWHHTAHWPQGGIDLSGLRVGVVGTGASGVQVIQEAAAVAEHLTVFQRTPILALPMRQRPLTVAEQDAAKADYPEIFRHRRQTNTGFAYRHRGESALAVSDEERTEVFEELWEEGGLAFWAGNFTDVLVDARSNRLAYEFWRDNVRRRLRRRELADALAPTEPPHPFGTKRPSLEQNYFEVFEQDNVTLVDLRTYPMERVTRRGVRTVAGEHRLDLLVLATGFDAVSGSLTAMDLRGTEGLMLARHWSSGVRTHLGVASHGFPNLVFLYGPQSPSGFCNGPTCAEAQGDWVVDLLWYLADHGITRIEATSEAESAWRDQVHAIAALTLFPQADSWYMGANIPGKPREMLNWPGGLQLYLATCRAAAEDGYSGFTLGGAAVGRDRRTSTSGRRARTSGAR